MRKGEDLTGKWFGDIEVLGLDEEVSKEKPGLWWKCKCHRCESGKIYTVKTHTLKAGKGYCGCTTRPVIGKRFGFLEVIRIDNERPLHWLCKCHRCNKEELHSTTLQRLYSGCVKSCGCLQKENLIKDLTGQKFGLLEVVGRDMTRSLKGNGMYWLCKCDCGREDLVSISTGHLKNDTRSCGCIKRSSGEFLVEKALIQLNLSFKKEVSFSSLRGIKYPLRFDFMLYDSRNNPYIAIECQGQQHYKPNKRFGGQEQFLKQKENDEKKKEYCKEHNIKLIEIPYWDFNKINSTYVEEIIRGDYYSIK